MDTFSEVYQQAYFYAGGFQVVDQLVIIEYFDSFFLFGVEAGFCQFDQEGVLVDGFKEAESEGVVDFVGARYYFGC